MKRVVIAVAFISLAACNWDEAEKKARCARDSSCSSATDAGDQDAGTQTDAGQPDAGPSRGVFFPANSAVSSKAIGLYPAASGNFWVVGNVDDDGIIQLRTPGGALVHDFTRQANVVSAYSNPAAYPGLAVLTFDGAEAELTVFNESGSQVGPVLENGRIVSVYVDNLGPRVSVWDTSAIALAQHILEASTLADAGWYGRPSCNVDFTDLEVLPPSSGGAVALIYRASNMTTCEAHVVTTGLEVPRAGGVWTITPEGTRRSANVVNAVNVGGTLGGELRLVVADNAANLSVHHAVWNLDAGQFDIQRMRGISATEGIRGGEVHDDYVTFRSGGVVSDTVIDGGVTENLQDAVVAHVAPWNSYELGLAGDSRMPVLNLGGDKLWVLWVPRDGGVQLTSLTWSLDGGFVVH